MPSTLSLKLQWKLFPASAPDSIDVVGRNLQSGGRLRPIDLARGHGLSTQAVRNYHEAGILPAADRTVHGYRTYTPLHARALAAFLALVPGHGHPTATAIMRAVNAARSTRPSAAGRREPRTAAGGPQDPQRRGTRPARPLTPATASATAPGAAPPRAAGLFIGVLADRLGIRPATLRAWERAGLVRPRRDTRVTGYRVYDEADVRDVRLAHQLRRGGYLLEQIAPLITQVRAAGGLEPLEGALGDWRRRLAARRRALLSGAAELEAYLRERE